MIRKKLLKIYFRILTESTYNMKMIWVILKKKKDISNHWTDVVKFMESVVLVLRCYQAIYFKRGYPPQQKIIIVSQIIQTKRRNAQAENKYNNGISSRLYHIMCFFLFSNVSVMLILG